MQLVDSVLLSTISLDSINHYQFCMKFCGLFCCRIAVFATTILKEERIIVVAEQKASCTEEEVFLFQDDSHEMLFDVLLSITVHFR